MTETFETIPYEQLAQTHGGRSTASELVRFAQRYGFHVTSTTGGRHLGWAHRSGRAADVRTRARARGRSARSSGVPARLASTSLTSAVAAIARGRDRISTSRS